MIRQLSVRHLAVVEDLSLSFRDGMTSLTGETGAGKSILVDALGLVLGDRADSTMIRHGHDRAEIEASFDIEQLPALQQWLIDNELDDEGECYLRRTISRNSASRGYINGTTVPISHLRVISELCIDIHGQHAHQSLLRPDVQRQLLDSAAGNDELLTQLSDVYRQWQQTKTTIAEHEQQAAQFAAQLELLQYQVNELSIHDLTDNAINELLNEQQKLANAQQLISASQSSLYQLTEQETGSAYSLISQTLSELDTLKDIEPEFDNIVEALNSAMIQIDEATGELRHYLDNTALDPARLEEVDSTLSQLHQLARKHHVDIEQLPEHYATLSAQLHALSEQEQQQHKLSAQLDQLTTECQTLCQQIHEQRQAAAAPLSDTISDMIHQLAMPGGRVDFVVTAMKADHFTETGADQVQLQVATNPGQAAGDLAKIASGGELARISLAIQVATANTKRVPTLVFDEVDVGIGGGIAEIVGKHLHELGQKQQVICITHLPQVAAQADQQLQVNKQQTDDTTYIELVDLSAEQRVEEIARMLGGVTITEATLAHAKEMLTQAN